MTFHFKWDVHKAAANQRKHGVTFSEAQAVFTDDLAITIPDPDHSMAEDRWVIIGISKQHRLLVVVYTERSRHIRLISARVATRVERQNYEEENFD